MFLDGASFAGGGGLFDGFTESNPAMSFNPSIDPQRQHHHSLMGKEGNFKRSTYEQIIPFHDISRIPEWAVVSRAVPFDGRSIGFHEQPIVRQRLETVRFFVLLCGGESVLVQRTPAPAKSKKVRHTPYQCSIYH